MEKKILTKYWHDPEHKKLDGYVKNDGYAAIKKVLGMEPDAVIEEAKKSKLRGRGGAGFPAGVKWGFLPKKTDKPKYVVCNADESEPGTFKDRAIIHHDPHGLIEGIAICCWAVQANTAFIYIRGEFTEEAKMLEQAIQEAYDSGYLGKKICGSDFDLELILHRGAGAYICGEETGMLESLEGKKGQPRNKPPFPATEGLFQCPTVINNVETLAALPWIMLNGGETYAKLGTPDSTGTKLVGISGPVKKPGVYEIELGMPLMTFINEVAGGMIEGKTLRAVIPGGSSTPPLTPEQCQDAAISYESLDKLGTALGTAGIIVIPDDYDLIEAMKIIARFYADESCGQCTPCREGTGWLYKTMARIHQGQGSSQDLGMLSHISAGMKGRTICALADAAAWPMEGFLRAFPEVFEKAVSTNKR
ncbi:MAG: NADH-quinone oxidoreductase subunit NuoF [Myxococcales bacterium]|nr:NADH-quinone oxidoreductase subunit NuoF [Myxococcales bacterium]